MQIQRVNRTDAEKVYIVIKNVSGATITTGLGARLVGGAAAEVVSTDGIQAVTSTDDAMVQFAGIAVEDIADNGYGRVQAWGIVNSVLLSAEADKTVGVTGIANSFLKAGAAAGSFTSTQTAQALSTMGYKYVQCLTTTNISGGLNYCKAFVRAL
jgi:hypothetical protein